MKIFLFFKKISIEFLGNENNFMTHDECEAMCDELIQDQRSSIFDSLFCFFSFNIFSFVAVHDPRCLVSMWSEWSTCSNGTCHQPGVQTRTRMYADKRASMIGHCSERLEEQRRCNMDCDGNQSKHKNKEMMTGMLR
jgi:hypothetical protein